jgi:hypothetical protein
MILKNLLFYVKKNPLDHTHKSRDEVFNYDFEEINKVKFEVNPNDLKKLKEPIKLSFFHKKNQREHIDNQLKVYSKHAIGLGKIITKLRFTDSF